MCGRFTFQKIKANKNLHTRACVSVIKVRDKSQAFAHIVIIYDKKQKVNHYLPQLDRMKMLCYIWVMLFANLKASLKDGLKPAYLLFGEDVFLVNKAIELITEAANVDIVGITRLDEAATSSEVIAKCRTVAMFGGRRAVIVRPAGEKLFDKGLTAYLAAPDTECVVILVCDKAANVKNTEVIDCNPMSEDLVVKLIARAAADGGKKINEDAVRLLARFCDNNFARVNNELNKLLHYFCDRPVITTQDVSEIAIKSENYQIYELGNAVLKKDTEGSERILKTLLASGLEEYALFGNILATIRRVFWAVRTKVPAEAVAALLKCHPYAVTASRRDFAALATGITSSYKKATDLEYQIKSGKISVTSALTLLQGLFS